MLVLAVTGCAAQDRPAIAPTSVAVSETSEFEVTAKALEELARSSDVATEELVKVGVKAGTYDQAQVASLMKALETEQELGLVDGLRATRRAVELGAAGTNPDPEIDVNGFKELVKSLVSSDMAELLLNEPATSSGGGARDSAQTRQRLSVRLDQSEKAALRRLSTKRKCRAWLAERLKSHRFSPSVSITVDVANSSARAIVVTEIAYISLPGIQPRAFILRDRKCNADASACRLLYAYDLTNEDVSSLKQMLRLKSLETGAEVNAVQNKLRAYLDSSDVEVEFFLDRNVTTVAMPGRLVKIDNGG